MASSWLRKAWTVTHSLAFLRRNDTSVTQAVLTLRTTRAPPPGACHQTGGDPRRVRPHHRSDRGPEALRHRPPPRRGARRRRPDREPRRGRRRDGPQRLRQDHAPQLPQRARHHRRRPGANRGAGPARPDRQPEDRLPRPPDGLRVPDVQPAPGPERHRERRAAHAGGRRPPLPRPAAGPGGRRDGRPPALGQPPPRRDERRPAPALHGRACARHPAGDRLGRRADGRPRQRKQRRDHGADARAEPSVRADLRVGHARGGDRRPGAASRPDARRADRLGQRRPAGGGLAMIAALGISPPTLAALAAGGVGLLVLILLGFAAFNRVLLVMALRNIPRRRAQTALIVVGLMLASLIITASFTVGDTLTYSLQSIEMKQIGGIDEAVARQSTPTPAGAGTTDADFFTTAQAAAAVDRARSDPNVDSAAGVIVAPGAVTDTTTGQASSENVVAFGVPIEFDRLWDGLHSRSGASLSMADLAPDQVYLGTALADRLNARAGDRIQLI